MSEEQRQSWNLPKPGSFDVHKNTIVLMIVMLDCLEVNIEVSDTSIETMESGGYREMSGDDEDANGVLAATQEEVRFFCKDR